MAQELAAAAAAALGTTTTATKLALEVDLALDHRLFVCHLASSPRSDVCRTHCVPHPTTESEHHLTHFFGTMVIVMVIVMVTVIVNGGNGAGACGA